jgi:thioredoxin-like negative regulator of GroEL
LIQLGRLAEAESVIGVAVERFPRDAALVILKARTLLRAGRADAAEALLSPLAERRDAFAARALGWLAAVELARENPRRAAVLCRRALALDPSDALALHLLATAARGVP